MKRFLTILLCLFTSFGFAQTTSFTAPTIIPVGNPDLPYKPEGGVEQWTAHQNVVNIPVQGTNTPRSDAYFRFQWIDIQPSNAAITTYSWTAFDNEVHLAIDNNQMFSFGIMYNCCTGPSLPGVGGPANCVYPAALHNAMQAETPRDWNNGGGWYENPNSPSWLQWTTALHQAIANHIATTTYKGVPYSKVVKRVDVRYIGDFGEQAVLNGGPTPTSAAMKALVDVFDNAYPNMWLTNMVGSFGANTGVGFTPQDVGAYQLQKTNNKGPHGWRWDSWGWTDGYMHSWLENNPNTPANGAPFRFDTAIMNRYKRAPVTGEPADLGNAPNNFGDLPVRVNQYHDQSFGNGNLDVNDPPNTTIQNNFRAASKAAGSRFYYTGGNCTTSPAIGSPFSITMNWQNAGLCPNYGPWNVNFELRTAAGAVVWSATSKVDLRKILPRAIDTVITDTYTLNGFSAGTYNLFLIIRDPNGYRKPMPIYIQGQNADSSYTLRSNIVITSSGTVTANAGPNQTITNPPTSSVTLDGSASVGVITSYAWSRVSGPNTPTIVSPNTVTTSVTGLIAGTYVFQLSVNGGVSTSTMTVLVNPGVVQANAGNNQTITLPTNSVLLDGSVSTNATTYSWTRVSGPNTPTIVSPSNVTTAVNGLIQGTYVFNLSINGGASNANVTITVNPAPPPVANAGADQNLFLPSTSATLNGTGSTGTITSYAWSFVSGPNTPSITNGTTATASVTGMIVGTYVFRLTLNGGTSTDDVTIVLNPAITTFTVFTNQTPPTNTLNDGQPIELGMKFRSSQTGYVRGVRFYKTTINTGTHVGELYLYSSGARLAQVTFTNETASGWQQMLFSTPVLITANTTYIISYFSPTGNYVSTNNYFTGPISNPPLVGLQNGTDGPNGVYRYTATPAIPNATFQSANYWVDVVFSIDVAPTAVITGPTSVILPTNPVINLSGTGSSDSDGTIAGYQWSQVSGPNTATIATPIASTTSITNLANGTYVFQLQVTDNLGVSGTSTISVQVSTRLPTHFTVGSGSGTVTTTSMSGLIPGDTLQITNGNYTSFNFSNLNHIRIMPLSGRPTFNSLSTFCNNVGVEFSNFNMVSSGGGTAIDATCGPWDTVSIHNVYFEGWTTTCINAAANTTYTYGNNATYQWLVVNLDSIKIFHGNKFIQGSATYTGVAKKDVMRQLNLTRIVDEATSATSNEGIGYTGICFHCSASDVTVTSTTFRAASGETGWIMGTGGWHLKNFYVYGKPGYIVYILPLMEVQDPWSNWITNSAKFKSTEYGLASYRFTAADTVTNQFRGTNDSVYNCTLGNQGASTAWGSLANNGAITPLGRHIVKNNFAFNVTSGLHGTIANNLGTWTSIAVDTSNNQYYSTATVARLDSTTTYFTNSLGNFTAWKTTNTSPFPLFQTGVTNPFVTTDIFGTTYRVPPDIGFYQFNGIPIPPPPACNCLPRTGVMPHYQQTP